MPSCNSTGAAKRSYPESEVSGGWERHPTFMVTAVAGKSYPTPKMRGGGREEQPHIQAAVAVRVQEGQEELLHVQGQEGRQ